MKALSAARHLTLAALFGALLYVSQVVMSSLPNIHIVALLIIIYIRSFPREGLSAVAIFILLEGFSYGFGTWWLSYLYIWPLFAGIVYLLRKWDYTLFWAFIAGAFGFSFGALCAIPYLFIGGWPMAISYWLHGLSFDTIHAAGNFIGTLLLYRPFTLAFQKIKLS